MIAVQDLFETHVTTADLARSVQFYKDVIGLRLAHVTSTRGAAFFWIGPGKKAMLGVWLTGSGPQRMQLHTAFQVSLADVVAAPQVLAAAGISPLDFDGETTDEPVVLAWMPAASVFFRDPDGHLLEFIAMLPDEPDPDRGVVRWSVWARAHGATSD
jgi:lactoylglutathione lyase